MFAQSLKDLCNSKCGPLWNGLAILRGCQGDIIYFSDVMKEMPTGIKGVQEAGKWQCPKHGDDVKLPEHFSPRFLTSTGDFWLCPCPVTVRAWITMRIQCVIPSLTSILLPRELTELKLPSPFIMCLMLSLGLGRRQIFVESLISGTTLDSHHSSKLRECSSCLHVALGGELKMDIRACH